MSDTAPTLLSGRYEVVAVVGRGGEGTLVRAIDRRHTRDVALKVRRVPSDVRDAERFLTESRTLLSLHPHPGLPLARDDFFEGDRHFLVMDWVEGVDLEAVLVEHGRPGLPPSTVLRWLAPTAEALTHLHTTDPPVIHGDVKPANLLLTPKGQIVLVDFGLSSTRGVRARGGTPGYRAPELAMGGLPTRAADVYGLAATAFALLSGRPPGGVLPPWKDIDPERAASLERALRRGLATDPARRTATPGELVEELRAGWDAEPLPTGVLTFLATDVVGSTRLWEESPDAAPGLLAEHLLVVDRAVERHGGRRFGDALEGDATISVFHRAGDALRAAIDLQRDLGCGRVQVHCGVHTGEAMVVDGGYFGATLSRVARIRAQAEGGQVLLSATTARLVAGELPTDAGLIELGPHRLAGFDEPEVLVAVAAPGLAVPPDPSLPPYPGLAAFQPSDRDLFFGREELAAEVAARVGPGRVVAIVGASGSGKSSLVRAGIVPRLEQAVLITPTERPLQAAAALGSGPLVVDQLEELVTLCADADEQAAFADLLVDHLGGSLVTVRADLYGHFAAFPRLAAAVAADHVLLGPLDDDQLRRAIEGPANVRGFDIEPGLVEAMLADARAEPGALPHVAHALSETWQRRDGRTLTLAGYRAAGGVRGALAQTAEQLHASLDERERSLLRLVLLRMVEPGQGVADARRPAPLAELVPLGQPGQVEALLQRLATARLVTLQADSAEPAHEALLREWPRLRSWIDDAREDLRVQRNLATAAADWARHGRDPSDLYRGARLATATEWAAGGPGELAPRSHGWLDDNQQLSVTERDFLAASIHQRDAERDAERRAHRRLRRLVIGLALFLVASIVAATIAVGESRQATRQEERANESAARAADEARNARLQADEARRQSVRATARALAGLGVATPPGQTDLALLLAAEGYRLDPSSETRAALYTAVAREPSLVGIRRPARPVPGPLVNAVGDVGVAVLETSTSAAETADALPDQHFALVDLTRGTEIRRFAATLGLMPTPDGRQVALVRQRSAALVDVSSGSQILELDGHFLGFDPSGRRLAIENAGIVEIHDGADGNLVHRVPLPSAATAVQSAVWSADGARLALVTSGTGPESGMVSVIDVATWAPMATFPTRVPSDAAMSGDAARIAVLSADSTDAGHLAVFDVTGGSVVGELRVDAPERDFTRPLALGDRFVAFVWGNAVRVYDLETKTLRTLQAAGDTAPIRLVLSPSEDRLEALRVDGATVTWQLDDSPVLRTLGTNIVAARLHDHVATAVDRSGVVRNVDLRTGEVGVATELEQPIVAAALSNGAERLAYVTASDIASNATAVVVDLVTHGEPLPIDLGQVDDAWVTLSDLGTVVAFTDVDYATQLQRNRIYDVSTGRMLHDLRGPFALAPDGQTFVAPASAGAAYALWRVREVRPYAVLPVSTAHPCLASPLFTPDSKAVAICDPDHGNTVFDVASTRILVPTVSSGGGPDASVIVSFSPDSTLFSFATPSVARVVELASGETVGEVPVGRESGVSVANDGTVVVNSVENITLWDARSGSKLAVITATNPLVLGVPVAGYAPIVLMGPVFGDSTLAALMVDTSQWIGAACQIAGRNLTQSEWTRYLPDEPYGRTCPQWPAAA